VDETFFDWVDARLRRRWRRLTSPVRAPPGIEPIMKHWSDDSPRQGAVVAVPLVWLAFILSLMIHIAVMWIWLPRMRLVSANPQDASQPGGPLAVRLATLPSETKAAPAPTPPPVAAATPPPRAQSPAMALRPLPRPPTPVITAPVSPLPGIVVSPPPPSPAPKAAPSPPIPADMDLSQYMAAKRRARGETESPAQSVASDSPAESDTARRDRIVAANLAAVRTPNLGNDPRNGGGLFEIKRLGADDAEFMFYGWNKEIKRRVPQMIEVKRGTNGNIQIALVRRMIAIIRDYEDGDFAWESRRLSRVVTLSARAGDNGELEAFMMKEFFDTVGTPR
jgi:hypothetical protein